MMLEHACRMGLEGVISKRADAPYRSGRGHDWIKSKCTLRQEFVIAGYLPSQAAGRGIRSLVLGYHEMTTASCARPAMSAPASPARSWPTSSSKLEALKTDASPFAGAAAERRASSGSSRSWSPKSSSAPGREAAISATLRSRACARTSRPRRSCMEKPESPSKAQSARPPRARPSRLDQGRFGQVGSTKPAAVETSVKLSHPDKQLWPVEHVTKQDLLDHYALVWPRMRQFVVNRPLALVRAPDGIEGQRFFQKHSMPGMRPSILKSNDPEDGEELLYIEDFDGLAALVQLGMVEIHIWGATVDKIDMPDQFVFDLDPDEGLDVEDVREAALDVHGGSTSSASPTS